MRKTIFDFDLCPVIPSPHESLLTGQNCFPVQTKTFSAHVKSKNEHDVREKAGFAHVMSNLGHNVSGKRFNAHAAMKLHRQGAGTDPHP